MKRIFIIVFLAILGACGPALVKIKLTNTNNHVKGKGFTLDFPVDEASSAPWEFVQRDSSDMSFNLSAFDPEANYSYLITIRRVDLEQKDTTQLPQSKLDTIDFNNHGSWPKAGFGNDKLVGILSDHKVFHVSKSVRNVAGDREIRWRFIHVPQKTPRPFAVVCSYTELQRKCCKQAFEGKSAGRFGEFIAALNSLAVVSEN